MPNFNINLETSQHANPKFQELASSTNDDAEQLLELVNYEASILHAKEALKGNPEDSGEGEDDDDFYGDEKGFDHSDDDKDDDQERWGHIPSSITLEDVVKDI